MRVASLVWLLLLSVGVATGSDASSSTAASSNGGGALAKYVRALSRPGAFKELRSVFGEEAETAVATAPPCPAGDDGLECRQREARRVLDDCPGGDCEACIGCNRSNLWPRCCQQNAMCCSNLAQACQRCEPLELKSFCAKNFKRCF